MGIRMLHRWPAPAMPLPPVPVFATDASTARLALSPAEALRHKAKALRHRFTPAKEPVPARPGDRPGRRLWTDLTRGYVALLRTLLPRTRRPRTLTVFTAPALTASRPGPTRAARELPHAEDPGPAGAV
ncbi:hypothetical protein ACFXAZ_01505 [Streptomyces sp. NPDC059477]|uniref:hypothetical protein n=1 Tax=Streptomyces sp. NPDC059477 TaxID=3346847 RepID=UPI00368558CC